MKLFTEYNNYIAVNNFKYEINTKKFKFEFNNTYNIQDKKSSCILYIINKTALKIY